MFYDFCQAEKKKNIEKNNWVWCVKTHAAVEGIER